VLTETTLDIKTLNSFVQDARTLDPIKKFNLAKFVERQMLDRPTRIERIVLIDPDWNVGDNVKFTLASFTKVQVSQGKKAGAIAWKSSDEALIVIDRATRGYAIDYDLITLMFSASEEKEVLVTGQYRCIDKKMIVEPGTEPQYEYKVPCYFLTEI